ncbi:hypothetical protein [Streptomyces sp. NPDC001286]
MRDGCADPDDKAGLVSPDSAGTVWNNTGDCKRSFEARTKIASSWQGYKSPY